MKARQAALAAKKGGKGLSASDIAKKNGAKSGTAGGGKKLSQKNFNAANFAAGHLCA